jgi:predicted transposase YbfD/YdcC
MGEMSKTSPTGLVEYLSLLDDPRVERTRAHALLDIMVIAVLATLSGAESFNEMEIFGREREQWLRQFLDLKAGIPSHDTFNRVFAAVDGKAFGECFSQWTQSVRRTVDAEIVAIDGKTLRRSHDRYRGKSALHVVSAWASSNGLVLGQLATEEKSNEITAVPALLRSLELAGCIVTVDALNTQKNIAKEIREADADYVLALKGNHPVLSQEIKSYLDDAIVRQDLALAQWETVEKGHGRIETRRYWASEQIGWLADRAQWEGLRSVAVVEATRDLGGQRTTERRYYLSSLPATSEKIPAAIRGHWGIENQLHWCLDVIFHEDHCRARSGQADRNLATVRALALNLLRQDTTSKRSLKGKRFAAAINPDYLRQLLGI